MNFKTSNGRQVIVSSETSLETSLGNWVPRVTILPARNADRQTIESYKKIIKNIIISGVKYIACIGSYSENLHDDIDDFLCGEEKFNDNINVNAISIITTYHTNEKDEEIADYVSYATDINDKKRECILFISDLGSDLDVAFVEILRNQ